MSLEINFFRKKNRYYIILHFFFLSNCCLFSIMSCHIIYYRFLTKVQLNLFWGPKFGVTACKAFSGKF